jgi:hypothetical protein
MTRSACRITLASGHKGSSGKAATPNPARTSSVTDNMLLQR